MPQRILSSLILIPVLVGLTYWSVWTTALVVVCAAIVGLYELYGAFRHAGHRPRQLLGFTFAIILCLAALFEGYAPFSLSGPALALIVLGSLINELGQYNREGLITSWALTLAGALYVGVLISYYILLRRLETPLGQAPLAFLHIPSGAAWLFLVLAVTWLQDTGAYFVGRALGRHKMAPYISPNKTWEGAAGGFVAAILVALLADWLLGLPISPLGAALIGVAGGIVGPLGDLAESLIKRQIGVKDAGNLIPGHGGVLDRMDSMVFTAPVIYYLIILLTVAF